MKGRVLVVLAVLALAATSCSKNLVTGPDATHAVLKGGAIAIGGVAPTTDGDIGSALSSEEAIVLPDAKPRGHSYGEWQARWWQWAYSIPVAQHPLFDETGANAAVGQRGSVWFLGGVFNVSGSASREITIPHGKALFFPILNFEGDNLFPPINPPLDIKGLRALIGGIMDQAFGLACELDGVPIKHLSKFRGTSPVFSVDIPEGGIPTAFGIPTPAGHYGPMVDDGYYLYLKPLSKGTHHLHFTGSVPGFTLDINYTIHVRGGGKDHDDAGDDDN